MVERNIWLEIIEILRNDIDSKIQCPKCKIGSLLVKDLPFKKEDPQIGGERFIECNNCEVFQIVLYRKPPENWLTKMDLD